VRVVATQQHADAVFLWQVGNVGNGHDAIPRLRDDLPLGGQLRGDRLAVLRGGPAAGQDQAQGQVAWHEHRAKQFKTELAQADERENQVREMVGRVDAASAEEIEHMSAQIGMPGASKSQIKKRIEGDINTIQQEKTHAQRLFNAEIEALGSYKQQISDIENRKKTTKSIGEYAKARSMHSYAEAGIMAMQETHSNPHARRPVHVGPELGWPSAYGSHPTEFVELIKGARERMTKLLTSKEELDFYGNPIEGTRNPYFNPSLNKSQAKKEASRHVKGVFDTSHFGMWLKHYKPHLPYEKRLKEFNKWYMDEVKKIAKDDVVGGIQLVDSATSAHGHLPPGEGIFPVVDAAKVFKKEGYEGFMVSEGHEEEKFDEGRIMVQTWKAFNAPISSSYGPSAPAPQRFGDVYNQYFKNWYSPNKMFGSYTPPFGEYKPWSEIPFE